MSARRVSLWSLWLFGVATFPIAAAFVLPDGLPFPHMGDYWRGIGVWTAWAVGFAAMAYAMFRLRGVSIRALVFVQLTAGVAFVFSHAMPSIDTYAYLGYGDQLLHESNPWIAQHVVAYDAITAAFTAVWGQNPPTCRYGPGFILFETALIRMLDGSSVWMLVVVQRLVSLFAAVGITALVRGPNARFWALNPFVSYYYVLEAHNDVLFLLALAAAARVRRPMLQGALVAFGGSIKIVALAAFARSKPNRAVLSIASATIVSLVLFRAEPLALNGDGLRTQLGSVANSIGFLAYRTSVSLLGPQVDLATVELGVAFTIAAIALFVRWSKRDAATFVILLSIAALPAFSPWYLGWALLAAVASSHVTTLRFVVMLCLVSFVTDLGYIGAFVFNTPITWLTLAASLALLVVCGVIPKGVALPGKPGTIFWNVRRLLTSRTVLARKT